MTEEEQEEMEEALLLERGKCFGVLSAINNAANTLRKKHPYTQFSFDTLLKVEANEVVVTVTVNRANLLYKDSCCLDFQEEVDANCMVQSVESMISKASDILD